MAQTGSIFIACKTFNKKSPVPRNFQKKKKL
jgi:hypothetical protein